MLISSAPIAMPANTANIPTESAKAEAVLRPTIPQPTAPMENPSSKNSTEFNQQPKNAFDNAIQAEKHPSVTGKEQSNQKDGEREGGSNDNAKKESVDQVGRQESGTANSNKSDLAAEQLLEVQLLKSRDREVRAHEQAHASVGGSLAGSPNLNFTTGPDGNRYAVSGEVSIDMSKIANDPSATLHKLEQVQRAALAPANPSSQDLKVASRAASGMNEARADLSMDKLQKMEESKQTAALKKQTEEENRTEKSVEKLADEPEKALKPDLSRLEKIKELINSKQLLNPVAAKRQSEQLNQKIAGSGALDNVKRDFGLSLTA